MQSTGLHRNAHIVVVGGAIVGSFCAWSLRQQGYDGPITVVEKDMTYRWSSTALSAAAIRTQFGTPVNVQMSVYGVDFFRRIRETFGDDADIGYVEKGYLILSDPAETETRLAAIKMQNDLGADIRLLHDAEVAERFPYLNREGMGVATFGETGEGWFDAWSLLGLVRKDARTHNVAYVDAEVVGFEVEDNQLTGMQLSSGAAIDCDLCIIATGPASGQVGVLLEQLIPVEPRKRTVFNFECPLDAPNFPFLSDRSGIWVKPEGGHFVGGIPPAPIDDPDATGDFTPQHELFEDYFWPALVERIPIMDRLRLRSTWAGHYEVNTLDHNGVIGFHDELTNLVIATGFSGHGVMHAPATGRGVAELILTGSYQSIDLSPLGWERIRSNTPMVESVII